MEKTVLLITLIWIASCQSKNEESLKDLDSSQTVVTPKEPTEPEDPVEPTEPQTPEGAPDMIIKNVPGVLRYHNQAKMWAAHYEYFTVVDDDGGDIYLISQKPDEQFTFEEGKRVWISGLCYRTAYYEPPVVGGTIYYNIAATVITHRNGKEFESTGEPDMIAENVSGTLHYCREKETWGIYRENTESASDKKDFYLISKMPDNNFSFEEDGKILVSGLCYLVKDPWLPVQAGTTVYYIIITNIKYN